MANHRREIMHDPWVIATFGIVMVVFILIVIVFFVVLARQKGHIFLLFKLFKNLKAGLDQANETNKNLKDEITTLEAKRNSDRAADIMGQQTVLETEAQLRLEITALKNEAGDQLKIITVLENKVAATEKIIEELQTMLVARNQEAQSAKQIIGAELKRLESVLATTLEKAEQSIVIAKQIETNLKQKLADQEKASERRHETLMEDLNKGNADLREGLDMIKNI